MPLISPLKSLASAVLVASVMTTGCGENPVSVSAPTPTGAAADACEALARALPDSVRGFSRRSLSTESPYAAAWGNDALVVLRCGVSRPDAMTASTSLIEVNGVDWLPETFERGTVFTTSGRATYVEVQVPIELRPEANALVDLAAAINEAVPLESN